mmetsp:Transcript_30087/g.93064  ORF Transcript_30087/g.93064 Transcript_30087/m.93064 type:complete len:270 (-) Transcript_30087:3015-3824(-)
MRKDVREPREKGQRRVRPDGLRARGVAPALAPNRRVEHRPNARLEVEGAVHVALREAHARVGQELPRRGRVAYHDRDAVFRRDGRRRDQVLAAGQRHDDLRPRLRWVRGPRRRRARASAHEAQRRPGDPRRRLERRRRRRVVVSGERRDRRVRRLEPVLVEAVAAPGSAKIAAARALDVVEAGARVRRGRVQHRMPHRLRPKRRRRRRKRAVRRVERDKEVAVGDARLQRVRPVRQHPARPAVPRGPGGLVGRHERRVAVDRHVVGRRR